jgi:hypothetical protein
MMDGNDEKGKVNGMYKGYSSPLPHVHEEERLKDENRKEHARP